MVAVVVVDAAGGRIFGTRGSSVGPTIDVAHFKVFGWNRTARDDTAAVAGKDGLAHVAGDKALFASEIQDLAFAVEDDRNDPGVAQFPAEVPGRDCQPVSQ